MKILTKTIISIIKLYKILLSTYLGNNCRYLPTCSEYFIESLNEHGLFKGSLKGLKRIFRCHPIKFLGGSEGFDPVRNYMNYASQECRNNFTQGQDNFMSAVISSNHMGYYENTFQYPSLFVNSVNIEDDTDGDFVLNPGDTARIRFGIENSLGYKRGVFVILLNKCC